MFKTINAGPTNVNIETTLSWNPAIDPEDDPITYRIEIRNDVNNDLEIIENITDTSYHLTNLVYGVKYFWQVVASDGVNDDVYSETFAPINRSSRTLYIHQARW